MCLGWLPQCALSLSTCVFVLVGSFVLFAQTSQSMLVKFVIIISIIAISSVLVVVFLAACASGASACCLSISTRCTLSVAQSMLCSSCRLKFRFVKPGACCQHKMATQDDGMPDQWQKAYAEERILHRCFRDSADRRLMALQEGMRTLAARVNTLEEDLKKDKLKLEKLEMSLKEEQRVETKKHVNEEE